MMSKFIDAIVQGIELFVTGLANLLVRIADGIEEGLELLKDALVRFIRQASRVLNAFFQLSVIIFPAYATYIWGQETSNATLAWAGGGVVVAFVVASFCYGFYGVQHQPSAISAGSVRKRRALMWIVGIIDIIIFAFCIGSASKGNPKDTAFLRALQFTLNFGWASFFETHFLSVGRLLWNFIEKNILPLLFALAVLFLLMLLVKILRQPEEGEELDEDEDEDEDEDDNDTDDSSGLIKNKENREEMPRRNEEDKQKVDWEIVWTTVWGVVIMVGCVLGLAVLLLLVVSGWVDSFLLRFFL